MLTDLVRWFVPRIRVDERGCWNWIGKRSRNGYGVYGRGQRAHRAAYELVVGPIPEGLEIDHLCRNRACVNPDHLEPVTRAENIRRGRKGVLKTACPHGHAWPEHMEIVGATKRRRCRTCHRERERERGRRLRAK